MNIDIFRADAFRMSTLSEAISVMPFQPTKIGRMGLFREAGITTTSIDVEMRKGVITLVPAADRGAPGKPVTRQRREMRQLRAIHLPQTLSVVADEVQNVRAFGSETDEMMAMALLQEKIDIGRANLETTIEYQRIGALKGQILDADGVTVLSDLFTTFDKTQIVIDMNLDVDTTRLLGLCMEAKGAVEDELGAVLVSGYNVLCGKDFFADFVQHPATVDAYRTYTANGGSAIQRNDLRFTGFPFADMFWEQYRGGVDGVPFIGDDEAYVIPVGVPDLFHTKYAPANYMETVNTRGLPFYVKLATGDFDKGVEGEIQSNPIHYCSRPRAIVKLVRT
jgi:hypothetical protein